MNTMQIDLLNPKAGKLLQDLVDLKLIAIRKSDNDGFMDIVNKIRDKAKGNAPSLDEITKEVKIVRTLRHPRK
ncbi:MAG: hypothetical protein EXR21_07605 [Flavobacteriaceae bacterium]|nr:hypothetical protein [Flavobacteriaceae bacterium]